jgi:hypothetical protein
MTSTAVWLNWHVELTVTGSVSSEFETQTKSEDHYQRGSEYFNGNGKPDGFFNFDC